MLHPVFQVIQICITAVLGIFGVAVAMNGFLFRRITPVIRILFLAGGLCMLVPESISDVVGIVLVALLCCNILMYLVMFFPVKLLAKIILIPQERLYPVVLMMCTVGAYATLNGRMFDVWCLLVFGIVGLLIKKFHFPVSCFLIGFILGGDLEDYFIQVLTTYNGYLTGLFVRPMAWVIWALIILSVVYAMLDNRKAKRQAAEEAAAKK